MAGGDALCGAEMARDPAIDHSTPVKNEKEQEEHETNDNSQQIDRQRSLLPRQWHTEPFTRRPQIPLLHFAVADALGPMLLADLFFNRAGQQ